MQVRPRGPDKCYSCRAWLFMLRGPASGHQPIHVMPNVHAINVKPVSMEVRLYDCGTLRNTERYYMEPSLSYHR
jgi:hypothetical protein